MSSIFAIIGTLLREERCVLLTLLFSRARIEAMHHDRHVTSVERVDKPTFDVRIQTRIVECIRLSVTKPKRSFARGREIRSRPPH